MNDKERIERLLADLDGERSLVSAFRAQAARQKAAAEHFRSALVEIASFDDKVANDYLAETGYFSCFDEPGSVQIARKALEEPAEAEAQDE